MNTSPTGTTQTGPTAAETAGALRGRSAAAKGGIRQGGIEEEFDAALLAAMAGSQVPSVLLARSPGEEAPAGGAPGAPGAPGTQKGPAPGEGAPAAPAVEGEAPLASAEPAAAEDAHEGGIRLPYGMNRVTAAARFTLASIEGQTGDASHDPTGDPRSEAGTTNKEAPGTKGRDARSDAAEPARETAEAAQPAPASATASGDAGEEAPALTGSALRMSAGGGVRPGIATPGAASLPATPTAQDLAAGLLGLRGGASATGGGAVVVPFADEHGVLGNIRLAVRGATLSATILTSDRVAADRLGQRVLELTRALTERGFNDPQVTVRFTRSDESAAARPDGRETRDRSKDADHDGEDGRGRDSGPSDSDHHRRAGSDRSKGGKS